MSARAVAKGLRVSPRKMGLVASLVRGRSVEEALVILEHTQRKAAEVLKKVVLSAQANARNNHDMSGQLVISQLLVSPGPILKRFRPVSRGRAHSIYRRSSHVTVEVSDLTPAKTEAPSQPSKQKVAAATGGKK